MEADRRETRDVVRDQREATLAAYRVKPSQIRTDANGEEKERREYAKRPILELLQNAEDALSDADRLGRVLLKLSGCSLVVANEGAPFTDRGFRALCTLDDSAKQAKRSETNSRRKIGSKGTGFKAVLNWTDKIQLRSGAISACFDRQAAAPIIRNALGSGGLRKLEEDRTWADENMPLLHVPLSLDPDAELEKLCANGWDTVFRLRVIPEKLDAVATALQDIDPRKWLFLERIKEVQVDVNDSCTVWRLDRDETNSFVVGGACYDLRISKNGLPLARYRVVRQRLPEDVKPAREHEVGVAEVGYAYQVDGEGMETSARIANFFSTDCPSPFPAIATHGTFLLKADRGRLAEDDLDFQRRLIDALCELACTRLIPELVEKYGAGALAYVKPYEGGQGDADGSSIEAEARKQLIEAVGSIRFVPTIAGACAAPSGLRLWNHGLGKLLAEGSSADQHDRLPTADWCNSDTRSILRGLGAEDLDPVVHAELLKHWLPPTQEAAFAAHKLLDTAFREISWPRYTGNETRYEQERFKRVAGDLLIWLTSNGSYRALNERVPFFESRKRHVELPSFLKLDWIDSAFFKMLKDRELWGQPFLTALRKDKLHGSARDDILRYGLLPQLKTETGWWAQHGFEVLGTLMELGFAADESSDVLSDQLREEVSRRVRVPTRDRGWQPAGSVYAGADWDNAWAENFVAGLGGKRFLLASPSSFTEKDDWKPLLLYCGASWAPKWRRHTQDESFDYGWPSDYRQDLASPPIAFARISGWEEFWRDVGAPALEEHLKKKPDSRIKRYPLYEAWALEGLEQFITGFDGNTARLAALKSVWEAQPSRRKLEIGLRGPQGGSFGRYQATDQNAFLFWQIKQSSVFEFPSSPLFRDGRATLSDLLVGGGTNEAWLKWLPRLRFSGVDDKERHALSQFALEFGAKESTRDYSAAHWKQWLEQLAEWSFAQPPIKELKDMMHGIARLDAGSSEWNSNVQLPCQTFGGEVRFDRLDELMVLDEPRFQALEEALLKTGRGLLLASIPDGKKLMKVFGCKERAVSALVEVAIENHRPCSEANERLKRIESKKVLILAWFEHAADEPTAERMHRNWPHEVLAHDQVLVKVSLREGAELDTLHQPFLLSANRVLHVQGGEGDLLWENFAGGLKHCAAAEAAIEDGLIRLLQAAEKSDQALKGFLKAKGLEEADVERWQRHTTKNSEQEQTDSQQHPIRRNSAESEPESQRTSGSGSSADHDAQEGGQQRDPTSSSDRSGGESQSSGSRARISQGSRTESGGGRQGASGTYSQQSNEQQEDRGNGKHSDRRKTHARRRGQEPRKHGQDAEDWFFKRLQEHMGSTWHLFRHDESGPGQTDVVIRNQDEDRLHIEVKGMKTDAIYWSQDEVKKAQWCAEQGIPYVLVVLIPSVDDARLPNTGTDQGDWFVHWVPDPLEKFTTHWQSGRVAGRWRWNDASVRSTAIQSQAPWNRPAPPYEEARSIAYEIRPSSADYELDGIDAVDVLLV